MWSSASWRRQREGAGWCGRSPGALLQRGIEQHGPALGRPHRGSLLPSTHHSDGTHGHEAVAPVAAGPGVPARVLALLQDEHLPTHVGLLVGHPAGERGGQRAGQVPPSSSPPAQPACSTLEGSPKRLWPHHPAPTFLPAQALWPVRSQRCSTGSRLEARCSVCVSKPAAGTSTLSAPLPQPGSSRAPAQPVFPMRSPRRVSSGLCCPSCPGCVILARLAAPALASAGTHPTAGRGARSAAMAPL